MEISHLATSDVLAMSAAGMISLRQTYQAPTYTHIFCLLLLFFKKYYNIRFRYLRSKIVYFKFSKNHLIQVEITWYKQEGCPMIAKSAESMEVDLETYAQIIFVNTKINFTKNLNRFFVRQQQINNKLKIHKKIQNVFLTRKICFEYGFLRANAV